MSERKKNQIDILQEIIGDGSMPQADATTNRDSEEYRQFMDFCLGLREYDTAFDKYMPKKWGR